MCTLIELLMSGAKSTEYLCKHLECDLDELNNSMFIMLAIGYKIDTFEEGGRTYVFLE